MAYSRYSHRQSTWAAESNWWTSWRDWRSASCKHSVNKTSRECFVPRHRQKALRPRSKLSHSGIALIERSKEPQTIFGQCHKTWTCRFAQGLTDQHVILARRATSGPIMFDISLTCAWWQLENNTEVVTTYKFVSFCSAPIRRATSLTAAINKYCMLGFELPHLCSCRPLEAQRNTHRHQTRPRPARVTWSSHILS